jgi:hypothetical protein
MLQMTAKSIAKLGMLAVLPLLLGCNPCKEEVWNSIPSPDHQRVAVTVMRDCGATTGEVLSVNVRPAGSNKRSAENNALVVKHGYAISVSWKDATTLAIECHECVAKEITAKRDNVGPVRILYDLS